jgi:hypothetical protein
MLINLLVGMAGINLKSVVVSVAPFLVRLGRHCVRLLRIASAPEATSEMAGRTTEALVFRWGGGKSVQEHIVGGLFMVLRIQG